MQQAPLPPDEDRRLALLAACKIMYTPAEQAFDDVARLAAELCGSEIALITLVDADYQWFKAKVGVEQVGTPRDLSFCSHCIVGRQAFVIPDTHLDERFADNPLVTGAPYLRSYAGVPLVVDGLAVGALSVADRTPRTLTDRQLDSLQRLAGQISRELGLRRNLSRATSPVATPPAAEAGDVPLEPGLVLGGRWTIIREIGRGGVGVVYEAREGAGAQRAAIKVLLPMWARHPGLLERFAREARVLMRLTSPHVAKLFDLGNLDAERGGLPYLVLEFLEGVDFADIIDDQGRVDYQQAFLWCADACDGLAEAHELGVVHRDLKPANVFLAETGTVPVVKVIDFGIAAGDPAGTSRRLTMVDEVFGSPGYMSPEQMMATASIDARSDIWSMGACLYELLTGARAFPGKSPFEIFANTQSRPPAPLDAYVEDIPAGVQAIVTRCLHKNRDERFASMRELAAALRALSEQPVG